MDQRNRAGQCRQGGVLLLVTFACLAGAACAGAGLESFLAPRAEIEPEPGGVFELRFGRRFWTAALQRLQQRFVIGPADWSTPQ
jgi:hypothetical protein